jgi:NADH-quinone oxidoreductase subunit G
MMDDAQAAAAPAASGLAPRATVAGDALVRLGSVPIYRSDAVVRRTAALQAHPLNRPPALRVHADDAARLGLADGGSASVDGTVLPVVVDAAVPKGVAWIEAGHKQTATLPPHGATLTVSKA